MADPGEKPNRLGIIDLGTNTFHLLIVDLSPEGSWQEIMRERIYVKLGEGGMQYIVEDAFKRALEAMERYRETCDAHHVSRIIATGTACLRTARNAPDLVSKIRSRAGISVSVIGGDREAALISKGIIMSLPEIRNPFLIMDIGGGSVEFILCDAQGEILFSNSYPIGVALLFHQYHKHDPISAVELAAITEMLENRLDDLFAACSQFEYLDLVGASGTFEVLADVMAASRPTPQITEIEPGSFFPFYEKVLKSHYAERLDMPEIPDTRADLIVVALFLIRFILSRCTFQRIIVSQYALKEGIIKEELDKMK